MGTGWRANFFQPVRSVVTGDLTHHERVVTDNHLGPNGDIGLGGTSLLIDHRKSQQETVEFLTPAVEAVEGMPRPQLLNLQWITHWNLPPSKTPGS